MPRENNNSADELAPAAKGLTTPAQVQTAQQLLPAVPVIPFNCKPTTDGLISAIAR